MAFDFIPPPLLMIFSLWLGRGCEVARQSRDAQKLLFQPILRRSDYCVIDLNELTQYGKHDFEQKQS